MPREVDDCATPNKGSDASFDEASADSMNTTRRVVVTGLGAITPLGNSVPEFWSSVVAGKSGVGDITLFDASHLPTRFAAEVRGFDAPALMGKKEARKADRFAQFAIVAAKEALTDSGLAISDANRDEIGVVMGSGIGGIITIENQHKVMLDQGAGRLSPFFIPMLISNIAPGIISMNMNVRGPTYTTVSACASSNNAIGEAYRAVQLGEAEAMICGGSEAPISPLAVAGFCAMRALSTRNDSPATASRPFDQGRDGFVMAEGGGAMMIEELEHARTRGARIYAEMVGYGKSSDAYHMVQPDPDARGVTLAMQRALRDAGLEPADVDYINAHATSTDLGDIGGDAGDPSGVRRARQDVAGQLEQVDVRPRAGRGRRARGHLHGLDHP